LALTFRVAGEGNILGSQHEVGSATAHSRGGTTRHRAAVMQYSDTPPRGTKARGAQDIWSASLITEDRDGVAGQRTVGHTRCLLDHKVAGTCARP
jgi:hypothetical protein